jgi:hypothetical protein
MVSSSEGLCRPTVEGVGCSVEVVLGELGHVGSFGEVLAEQSVGVFVGSSLPGALRVTEVELDSGVDRELGVLGHLFVYAIRWPVS